MITPHFYPDRTVRYTILSPRHLAIMSFRSQCHPMVLFTPGILVSEGAWLRAQAKLYEETGSQDNADYCNRLASEYDDNPDDTITALHMKEVKIISHPTADMPILMWRIRIDRVDAFHVGRMP